MASNQSTTFIMNWAMAYDAPVLSPTKWLTSYGAEEEMANMVNCI